MIPRRPRDRVELTPRRLRVLRAPSPAATTKMRVAVGVTTTNPGIGLVRCLESIRSQDLEATSVGVVLLIDGVATDELGREAFDCLPESLRERTFLLTANCGTPSRARNTVLSFVDDHLPGCRWVARLDDDDSFTTSSSLEAAVALGDKTGAEAVLGGNRVLSREGRLLRINAATDDLLDPSHVLRVLEGMVDGTARNELPSCNLVLRAHSGHRYPDASSAEDHWLVAELLLLRRPSVAILSSVLFADYTLDGELTRAAREQGKHAQARRSLLAAARSWRGLSGQAVRVLGHGQEGVVWEDGGTVTKRFYAEALRESHVRWLEQALATSTVTPRPAFRYDEQDGVWIATYPYEPTTPFERADEDMASAFLVECLRLGIVCGNVKRTNFRVTDSGRLLYVDVGSWIVPMDVSVLLDAAARLYAIGVLGWPDDELLRRPSDFESPLIWHSLPGFADFYRRVIDQWIAGEWSVAEPPSTTSPGDDRPQVTLLIKACGMDAGFVVPQVRHIVEQLASPRPLAERVLAIDSFDGPFLRAHQKGDLQRVRAEAESLRAEGLVDRILLTPSDPESAARWNRRWFGVDCRSTHSFDGVPVVPQIWAFDQLDTRYVLQCDLDVLVGRRSRTHDYLADMLDACQSDDVVGVAFNIPFPSSQGFRAYAAPPGEYKPEVRLGLLDLERIRSILPLPANVVDGALDTTWYRALHEAQRRTGLRTVRGGHPDTFYVHPPNDRKADPEALHRIRDVIANGHVPEAQLGHWDLECPDESWRYRSRSEEVVVLARGRNTPVEKIRRFAASLRMQNDASFGVVVIDDGSDPPHGQTLSTELDWLGPRLTLVRHATRRGRMVNNRLAIGEICVDPASTIVMLDLDDALADRRALQTVREHAERGHDLILGAPFLPDRPTHLYRPDFAHPRETFGGDVWIHLRAFRKSLFDALPEEHLKLDGEWIDEQDDYALMVPVAELARTPVYIPRFLCWHERSTVLDEEGRRTRDERILRILAKPSVRGILDRTSAMDPARQPPSRGASSAETH